MSNVPALVSAQGLFELGEAMANVGMLLERGLTRARRAQEARQRRRAAFKGACLMVLIVLVAMLFHAMQPKLRRDCGSVYTNLPVEHRASLEVQP